MNRHIIRSAYAPGTLVEAGDHGVINSLSPHCRESVAAAEMQQAGRVAGASSLQKVSINHAATHPRTTSALHVPQSFTQLPCFFFPLLSSCPEAFQQQSHVWTVATKNGKVFRSQQNRSKMGHTASQCCNKICIRWGKLNKPIRVISKNTIIRHSC